MCSSDLKADFEEIGHAQRLADVMIEPNSRVTSYLAFQGGNTVGFLALSREFSTWRARDYLHIDCLYVTEEMRGQGIGHRLIAAAIAQALEDGIIEIQWQTPKWNVDAIRFYHALGAIEKEKSRFILTVPINYK